jgi:hypothetical protein
MLAEDLRNLLPVLAVFAASAAVCFGFAATLFWLQLRSVRKQRERDFPVEIPGWGMRMTEPPPFHRSLEQVGRLCEIVTDRSIKIKGYKRSKVLKKIAGLNVTWIPAAEQGNRFIIDAYGRKIAGDHNGNHVRIVYLMSDRLSQTAMIHEIGHELHELERRIDYDHADDSMWVDVVEASKKEMRSGRF